MSIKNILTRKPFDFMVSFNGVSIYSICKNIEVVNSAFIYDAYALLRLNGFIDEHKHLTEKGKQLQDACILLNEKLNSLKSGVLELQKEQKEQ